MRHLLLGLSALALASCTIFDGTHYHHPPDQPNACYSASKSLDGDLCSSDTQCCSGTCGQEGTCCEQLGARCDANFFGTTCCVGECRRGTCVCAAAGQRCSRYSDCCSGDCNNGTCVASNTTCATSTDCLVGTCDHFRCVLPSDLAVSLPDAAPVVDLATVD